MLLPDRLAESGAKIWANCLVGIVLARRMPIAVIRQKTMKLWGGNGLREVIGTGPGRVLLRFADDSHFDGIMERGDWHILGCPFILRRWTPELSFDSLEPGSLPLWVRLKNIPFEYMHVDGIEYIANGLGKPLRMGSKLVGGYGYVRVQIEFDARVELKRKVEAVTVSGHEFDVDVEYEYFPPQCVQCGVFGHVTGGCSVAASHAQVPDPVIIPPQVVVSPRSSTQQRRSALPQVSSAPVSDLPRTRSDRPSLARPVIQRVSPRQVIPPQQETPSQVVHSPMESLVQEILQMGVGIAQHHAAESKIRDSGEDLCLVAREDSLHSSSLQVGDGLPSSEDDHSVGGDLDVLEEEPYSPPMTRTRTKAKGSRKTSQKKKRGRKKAH